MQCRGASLMVFTHGVLAYKKFHISNTYKFDGVTSFLVYSVQFILLKHCYV